MHRDRTGAAHQSSGRASHHVAHGRDLQSVPARRSTAYQLAIAVDERGPRVKLLLTGGTGFLGGRLVSELLSRGHQLVCLVRTSERAFALRREIAAQDLERM